MSGRNREAARQWMRKAANDLFTARHVLSAMDGPTDTPCFHAQQAVEKTLKAVLTAAGLQAERTHDLPVLLDQAVAVLPGLATHREWSIQLSEYAVVVRYPVEVEEPARSEAEAAVAAAAVVYAACAAHLGLPVGEQQVDDEGSETDQMEGV